MNKNFTLQNILYIIFTTSGSIRVSRPPPPPIYDIGSPGLVQYCSQECWEQYWTSPGDNTPQDTNYTATCLPSRKLYKLDEPDTRDTAGEARTNSSVMYSYGPPHMAKQKQDDQLEHTYSSYVRIRDVTLKTCQKRQVIGRSGERGSGISVLAARHDDNSTTYQFP